MGRFLKIVFGVVAVVVLIVVAAAVLIPLFVDPNDFKGEIEKRVQAATGRSLAIDGDIELSVFPWLGLELNKIRLSNAPGFGEAPFMAVQHARIRAKLLPLFEKRLEVDTVGLDGLRLNLARDRQGHNNWDDLARSGQAGPKQQGDQKTVAPGAMLGGFAVSGVEISNAQVRWDDSSTGQQIALQKVNLTTGQLVPGEPVDVKLDFAVDSKAPELTGDVALNGTVQVSESMQQIRVTPVEICLRDARLPDDTVAVGCLNGGLQADLASRQFLLNGMVLDLEARGGALPPDGLSAELKGDVAADLAKQTLRFTGFQLQSGGLRLTGEINAKSLLGEPSFAGRFTLNEFSPRDLLETMALPAPETADPAVLSRLAAEFEVAGDTNQVTLKPVVVALDDTQIDGDIAVRDFANPLVSFALRVDSIDVDRYLPPPTETAKTAGATSDTPVESAPKNAALFPVAVLRTLNVDGRFTVDALKVSGLKAEKVQLELKASDGKIQLDQTVGSFYEGGYNGRLNLDASAEIPRVHTVNRLTGIQVGPLLKDLTGEDRLTGRGHFNADLRAQGQNPQALRASLGGGLDFRFHDGAVKGINLAKLLRETKARLKGKPVVPMTEAEQTDFSEISASFQADRGVLSNRDLQGKSPLLRVTGKGDADLVRELLDYRVEAVIVGTLKGQGGDELEQLRGVPIPVQIRGPFAKLDYTVDWSKVVEDRAKAKAQEQIDKHKDKLLDKLFNR